MAENSKRILVRNCQTKGLIDTWDYDTTRSRYFNILSRLSQKKSDFTDAELLDFLSMRNSYCEFEIINAEDGADDSRDQVSQDVQYVDEDGNAIDPEDIDSNAMEFTDEYGRPTDATGNLLNEGLSEYEARQTGEKLLRAHLHPDLIVHCVKHLELYPGNASLWRLLGVAYGSTGNESGARKSFLSALRLDPNDGLTLANYITSCFHAGDVDSAREGIEQFFDSLRLDEQRIVLESLLAAIRCGWVQMRDLPDVIRKFLFPSH